MRLDDWEDRGWAWRPDNEQLPAVVEQNPRQSIREMS